MDYLEHSPVGSLGIYDFKASQFVLSNGTIKLSDLDDLSAGEPGCNLNETCRVKVVGESDLTGVALFILCVYGVWGVGDLRGGGVFVHVWGMMLGGGVSVCAVWKVTQVFNLCIV